MPRRAAAFPTHQRSRGGAALRFAVARGETRLADLHQAAPMRVLFPTPEPGEPPLAALVNTAGGLAGGDEVRVDVALGPGAHGCVSTPAAEKVYRSLGPETRIAARLEVGEGATLEWLPQETILFDGARLTRRLDVELAPGATLLLAEMLVFGRHARGEALREGSLLDTWRLRRGGSLAWADGLALGEGMRERLDAPFGFAGAEACATLLVTSDAPLQAARDAARKAGAAATLPRPGLMVLRWLGGSAEVRDGMAGAIRLLRARVLGAAPVLPRLWTC
ncbi:urease accessory protein UreD [Roseomonas eburnea]|uniref:Urease accessory protein UreD n=1 Tax=Neoroseomonas eburnea TaxID=1346889 RepID=A0A9X9X5B4_9PROT|nr:urease accessory protein UreD [Neoroseomonas eburnea]MBR0678900.1 urease accessory protein UreD [Neoroseomonas eburnea]